jgi:hypothetical protein
VDKGNTKEAKSNTKKIDHPSELKREPLRVLMEITRGMQNEQQTLNNAAMNHN